MNFGLTSLIISLILLALLFFISRLAVSWAIHFAMVGLIFITTLGGVAFWVVEFKIANSIAAEQIPL